MSKKHSDSNSTCPIAAALDIVGDRWTLLIIRDMLFGNVHEYKNLMESAEGISTNILAVRLKALLDGGLIEFIRHPGNQKRKLYYLTPPGKRLIHPMIELSLWSHDLQPDSTEIPEAFLNMMKSDKAKFVQMVIAKLESWEGEHGITH